MLIMNEINIKVNGMMCGGCENRVKNALENIEGVKNVTADHTTGNVNVVCDAVDVKMLEETIEDIGYEVIRND